MQKSPALKRSIGGFVPVWAALFWLLIGGVAAAEPVSRALLVGVSNYPKETVGEFQLAGPKNDVALMIDTLPILGIAPENAIVLADSLEQTTSPRPADGMPTRKAILDGLALLAARSQRGDFALIYLSGHGSRQPDLAPEKRAVPKADGFDEVFLPIDIGVWDSDREKVENALLDFELGQAVAAIRAKGAHVWVIVDACHSGTMTRATGDAVIKQVPMEALKIPQAAIDKARALAEARAPKTRSTSGPAPRTRSLWSGRDAPAAAPEEGSYVAFFAAHPDERARQEALPKEADDRLPRGVMTWHLVRALRLGQSPSYRDLGFLVLQGYDQLTGRQVPVPMFEGDLTRPVIGSGTAGERRYLASRTGEGLSIAAGLVDGLTAGAIVSLALPDAPEKLLGYGRIERPGLAKSGLVLVERDGLAAKADDFRKEMPLVARVVEKGMDLSFSVGVLDARPATPGEVAARDALEQIGKTEASPFRIVAGNAPADVYLKAEDDRLWLIPPDSVLEKSGRAQTPSVALTAATTPDAARRLIEQNLARLAKTRNLMRIAGVMGPTAMAKKLTIEAFLHRDGRTAPANARAPDDRSCRARQDVIPDDALPISGDLGTAIPDIRHCDRVYFRLTNTGDAPIDITPLYIDGAGHTSYHGAATGVRVEPKSVPTILSIGLVTFNTRTGQPEAIGHERMLFIAVEIADKQAIPADFRYLADVQPTRNTVGGPAALRAFLNTGAFAQPKTRSSVSAPALGDGAAAGIIEYRWRVVAPEGAR